MKRVNDSVNLIYPPIYRQNSCYFDCAYMALFGVSDSWINNNFLYYKIFKNFINSYNPSLHLKSNNGSDFYYQLYKKNKLNDNDLLDIIEYAKTIPSIENNENVIIYSNKINKKFKDKKFVKKLVDYVRKKEMQFEITNKTNLQNNLRESVNLIRKGKKIESLLDIFKQLIINNKCIPDDEEMKQTLFTYQEQSAISMIRFLFDLFYIKPATITNTKIYSNTIENINNILESNEKIISESFSHPIYLLQSCDFIKENKIFSINELLESGNNEIHNSDSGFEYQNNKFKYLIKNQKITKADFLVIELERFIFPTLSTKNLVFMKLKLMMKSKLTIKNYI